MSELKHFGVKGMQWGVRRMERKTQREASKDAKRHMDAKMAYGDGAGTRRKLLKAELTPKLKDPFYAKSFEDALSKISTAKAAANARGWRARQDAKDQTVRSVKQAAKYVTGTTSVAAIGLAYLKYKPQVDAFTAKVFAKLKG